MQSIPTSRLPRRGALRVEGLERRVVPAITTSFDSVAGRLVVRSDSADAIVVAAAGPVVSQVVTVNGHALATPAASVRTLDVRGGPGANRINLSGVRPAAFSGLTSVLVDAGAGDDRVTGSPLADDILGGPGNDVLRGMAGNDTLRGGGGLDRLDGGTGDDVLRSGDPVEAGFNDASGLNADATPDSPYQIGGILFGHGQGESGWAAGWQQPIGGLGNAVVQSDVVFEGDGALKVSGGTTDVYRDWSTGVTAGTVTVSQMIYIPAGGGFGQYLQDGTLPTADQATAAQWTAFAASDFQVLDSGVWEDTGIPVPVQQWVRVDIAVDMTARTYDFYVDGIKYVAPDPIGFRGNPGALNQINFLLENLQGFYVDAIQVDGADAPTTGPKGDTLRGGPGADTLRGGSGPDLLDGGADSDSLSGGTGNDTLLGGPAPDDLSGDDGNDLLKGQAGSDTLAGGAGNDDLLGGADPDLLDGGQGADSLDGGAGNDVLTGGEDPDSLAGGPGDDSLDGGAGNDRVLGAAGNDLLRGGGGGDWLDGGAGDDRVESADPPPPDAVVAGINDAEGLNADPTANSPYTIGGVLAGSGDGEPGWAGGWTQGYGSTDHVTVQSAVRFEGDGAIQITGGGSGIGRSFTDGQTAGVVTVTQMINVPAGGGVGQYLQDGTMPDTPARVAVNWDAVASQGDFRVLDGDTWEDTGFPIPIGQWVKVETRVDMTNRTFQFLVNDVPYVPPDPLDFRGNPGAFNNVGYLVENLPGVYIDAVQVTGPDPAGAPGTFGDTLAGGVGNDTLVGDRGADLMLGGSGRDSLDGGAGRDLLVGGADADTLRGGLDQDILIGGTSAYDRNPLGLPAILAEWNSGRDAATRFANISGTGFGPRLNGVYVLNAGAVRSDGRADSMSGGDDVDWFFAKPGEDTTDATGADLTTGL